MAITAHKMIYRMTAGLESAIPSAKEKGCKRAKTASRHTESKKISSMGTSSITKEQIKNLRFKDIVRSSRSICFPLQSYTSRFKNK